MQPWGIAVSCLLQPLAFWPWRVCGPPACRLTLGGGGGSGTHRPLPLVGWPPLLDLHTSFPYNCPFHFCFYLGFWLWLRFGGWFGLWLWCGGVSGSSSLTSTKMVFIIHQVFGLCTNILRHFHRRHRLKKKKTSDVERRHEDI